MSDFQLFTSESVADGHPDKICDQISDAILDACLEKDQSSRVAVETAIKNSTVFVLGELTTLAEIDVDRIVRDVLTDIGHGDRRWGLDLNQLTLIKALTQQSPDIAMGVGRADGEVGAGDQGMMFGFATAETDVLMPLPIQLAHRLMQRQREVRRSVAGADLGPDAKSQVTVAYRDGRASHVETIVISTQHAEYLPQTRVHEIVRELVIAPIVPTELLRADTKILINPTGKFVEGGPVGDAGLTGRKIIVDTYGGAGRHGGGAFSGKDPTKVDRSAAYAARQLARAVVASKLAQRAEVQVSYAIGVAEPVSITLWSDEGRSADENKAILAQVAPDAADMLKPARIIERLALRRPLYRETARFGHFGRPDMPWEQPLA